MTTDYNNYNDRSFTIDLVFIPTGGYVFEAWKVDIIFINLLNKVNEKKKKNLYKKIQPDVKINRLKNNLYSFNGLRFVVVKKEFLNCFSHIISLTELIIIRSESLLPKKLFTNENKIKLSVDI